MNCLIITNLQFGSFRILSPVCAENPYSIVQSIVSVSNECLYCFIINDRHSMLDKEFDIMPPHNIKGTIDCHSMTDIECSLKSRHIDKLYKTEFDAIHNKHNFEIIKGYNFDNIYLSGFCASMDILETAKSLKKLKSNIIVNYDCICDLTQEMKDKAFKEIQCLLK